MFGQYKKQTKLWEGVLTGKGGELDRSTECDWMLIRNRQLGRFPHPSRSHGLRHSLLR